MTNINPAAPSQEATPGKVPQNGGNPSAPSSANQPNGGQGNDNEGTVTIPLKEYRTLQRQDARAKSLDRRNALNKGRQSNQAANLDDNGGDPELVNRLAEETRLRQEAEQKALRVEVGSRVRDLLEKDEFKTLPNSTKQLILKNPSALSNADNLEEALLDIEDFVRDEVLKMETPSGSGNAPGKGDKTPETPETPPVNNGAPAPSKAGDLEDLSKLSGSQKSRAAIRNLLKTGGKK